MTEGVIWKQLLYFTLPIFFASVFQQVYNMVDVWFIGNFVGTEAVAATGGTTGSFINLTIALFNGFSSAITIIIGQLYGMENKKEIRRVIQNALIFCVAVGGLLSILCVAATPALLRICNLPEEIMEIAVRYLRVYFCGTIFVFSYNVTSGMLRAIGDSRTPLLVLGICCAINIFGDWLLVVVFRQGVAGAAIATIVSQGISVCLNLYILLRVKKEFRSDGERFRLQRKILRKFLVLGVPCGVQNMMYSVANLIMQSVINRFGTDFIAAFSIYSKADMVCWYAVEAFGLALTTFSAQNYSVGKIRRIRTGTRLGVIFAALSELIFSGSLLLFARVFFRAFTKDADVIAIGLHIVHIIVPFYVTYTLIDTLAGTIRGMGQTVIPMILTFTGICVLRVSWVIAADFLHTGYAQVLYNYPFTWILTSTMFAVYYICTIRRSAKGRTDISRR